ETHGIQEVVGSTPIGSSYFRGLSALGCGAVATIATAPPFRGLRRPWRRLVYEPVATTSGAWPGPAEGQRARRAARASHPAGRRARRRPRSSEITPGREAGARCQPSDQLGAGGSRPLYGGRHAVSTPLGSNPHWNNLPRDLRTVPSLGTHAAGRPRLPGQLAR